MNITKESVGNNASKIKLEFVREDFQPAVDKKLKEYRRKANIPGFRVGMAPIEVVKKMVGGNILADEVNEFISKSLETYIKEQELDLLGYPLSSVDNQEMDLDNDTNFVMTFDVAEMPKFDTNLKEVDVDYYNVEADDESIGKNIEYLRERFGKEVEIETIVDKKDKVTCDYVQVNEAGEKIEDGAEKTDWALNLELVSDKFLKKLMKLKVGGSITANPKDMVADEKMIGELMGLEQVEDSNFMFTMKTIKKIELAEIDKDFFNQVMPDKGIETEDAFKDALREQSTFYFKEDVDKFFYDSAIEAMIKKVDIDLPFEFLKRWVETNSNGEVTADAIEAEKENYINGFKSDILKSKIVGENNLAPTMDETMDFIKQSIAQNFYGPAGLEGIDDEAKSLIDRVASQIINNEKEVRRFYDAIAADKLVNFLKTNLNVTEKKVKSNEFSDIIMNKVNKKETKKKK